MLNSLSPKRYLSPSYRDDTKSRPLSLINKEPMYNLYVESVQCINFECNSNRKYSCLATSASCIKKVVSLCSDSSQIRLNMALLWTPFFDITPPDKASFYVIIYGVSHKIKMFGLVFTVDNEFKRAVASAEVVFVDSVDNGGSLFAVDVHDSARKSDVRALFIYNDDVSFYIQLFDDLISFLMAGVKNEPVQTYSLKYKKRSDNEPTNLTENVYLICKNYIANEITRPKKVVFSVLDGGIYYDAKEESIVVSETLRDVANAFVMCPLKKPVARAYTIYDIWEFREIMTSSSSLSLTDHPIDAMAQDFINILPLSETPHNGIIDKMNLLKICQRSIRAFAKPLEIIMIKIFRFKTGKERATMMMIWSTSL